MYKKYVKRLLDISSALALFIVLIPAFLLITLLVRLRLGSPVFFTQERTGLNGRKFKIIKFRTMTEAKDKAGNYLPDEERITRWGRILRSTSLDELPELLNIIGGQMSVVGPRPLPPTYDPYYNDYEKKRFTVRGGLIPPDTVKSSEIINWDTQLQCEAEYAERVSFKGDLHIFIYVFKMLLTRNKHKYGEYKRKRLNEERSEQITDAVQTSN